MQSKANAIWKGGLKDGQGTYSAESGAFQGVRYGFGQRFEGQQGSTPEELIAAAHASCFAMASSAELGKVGITPESLEARCTVTFEKDGARFSVTSSHLELTARIPGADRAKVGEAIEAAKAGCPISRLLSTKITLDWRLE